METKVRDGRLFVLRARYDCDNNLAREAAVIPHTLPIAGRSRALQLVAGFWAGPLTFEGMSPCLFSPPEYPSTGMKSCTWQSARIGRSSNGKERFASSQEGTDFTGAAPSALRGLRVLFAEDDLLIAQLISSILVSLGCTVIGPVGSLDEALQAIRMNEIDGALLDVQLGQANVYPALDELAQRGIPFILMTGHGNLGELRALLNNAPLLTKPFKLQQLEDIMNSTFRLRERGDPHPS